MKFSRFCSKLVLTAFVFLSSTSVVLAVNTAPTDLGQGPVPVPEPGMLPLFAIGAAIAFIVKKRKK